MPDAVSDVDPSIRKEYAEIISRHIPYFNELVEAEKQLFLKRAFNFRVSKKFHFIGMTEKPEIPILVSAAAVQITFGLNKYLLSYFRDIL